MSRLRRRAVILAALCTLVARSAIADDFPSKPIRIVSPHQAGGAVDTFARTIAPEMGALLGQQIVIESKPGAAGTIGAREVAASRADGHTLLGNASIQVMYPGMFASLPFDPMGDFVPVGVFGSSPIVLAVGAQSPIGSFAELIETARAKPGTLTFGSGGLGSLPHLVGELVNQRAGVKMMHIAYNGTAPAVTDTAGGHVTVLYAAAPVAEPLIRSGRLRALAVSSASRMASLPDVPTIGEAGVEGFDATAWYALWAPKGTPVEVVAKLNKAMRDASAMPAVQQRMRQNGITPSALTADGFAAFQRAEGSKWLEVMKRAGLTPK